MSFSLGLSHVFSRLALWVFERNAAEVKCLSQHIVCGRAVCDIQRASLLILTFIIGGGGCQVSPL